MSGAIAAGSPHSVEAGLRALRLGGGALDAAISAALVSCVVEPTLTGLGGAGLATIQIGGGAPIVCDMFGAAPGLGRRGPPPRIDDVGIDFGTAVQVFSVGPGSVATPGLPAGLWALHQRWGRLSMPELAAPAARLAREGVPVSPILNRVFQLLWPILQRSPDLVEMYGAGGAPRQVGDRFYCPALGDSLERFGAEGPDFLYRGDGARAALRALGPGGALTAEDLERYAVRFSEPLRLEHHGAEIFLPGPPSVGGLLVTRMLGEIAAGGGLPGDLGAEEIARIAPIMERALASRDQAFWRSFADPGFSRAYLARSRSGFTTHISAVDDSGSAVSLTTTLGESAGLHVPETGVLLNNLMGEADVNPREAALEAGARLVTMCAPALVRRGERLDALGAGGSSRIPTAILHGLIYLIEHGDGPSALVRRPRAHMEAGDLRVEGEGRPPGTHEALLERYPGAHWVGPGNLFFGGLNAASAGPQGFEGAGDPRRACCAGAWPEP